MPPLFETVVYIIEQENTFKREIYETCQWKPHTWNLHNKDRLNPLTRKRQKTGSVTHAFKQTVVDKKALGLQYSTYHCYTCCKILVPAVLIIEEYD